MRTIKTTHYKHDGKTLCGVEAKPSDVFTSETKWFNAMTHKCKKCQLIRVIKSA